jgi:hypothetical protein
MSDVPLRLNLGSGQHPKPGYVNVDKFGTPDVKCDLETFPWPWPDSSVDEVRLHHVLEHLGESVAAFFGIIKELYRVCKDRASVFIVVPHPRHDDFLGDPTHVRPFMPDSFYLYSKEVNQTWQKSGFSNSPLGLYLDVDFTVAALQLELAQPWLDKWKSKELTDEQVTEAMQKFNNVVKTIRVQWTVIKPSAPAAGAPPAG